MRAELAHQKICGWRRAKKTSKNRIIGLSKLAICLVSNVSVAVATPAITGMIDSKGQEGNTGYCCFRPKIQIQVAFSKPLLYCYELKEQWQSWFI